LVSVVDSISFQSPITQLPISGQLFGGLNRVCAARVLRVAEGGEQVIHRFGE